MDPSELSDLKRQQIASWVEAQTAVESFEEIQEERDEDRQTAAQCTVQRSIDEALLAFVNTLPPLTRECCLNAENWTPRVINGSDPLARIISQIWTSEEIPKGFRRISPPGGSGGVCFAVESDLLNMLPAQDRPREHVIKMCFEDRAVTKESTLNEARVYKWLSALQGICLPEILDCFMIEIADDKPTSMKPELLGQLTLPKCDRCKDPTGLACENSGVRVVTSPIKSETLKCKRCRERFVFHGSLKGTKVMCLIMKECGLSLDKLLVRTDQLNSETRMEFPRPLMMSLIKQYTIFELYTMYNLVDSLKPRNIVAVNLKPSLTDLQEPQDFAQVKVLFIDLARLPLVEEEMLCWDLNSRLMTMRDRRRDLFSDICCSQDHKTTPVVGDLWWAMGIRCRDTLHDYERQDSACREMPQLCRSNERE